MTPSIRPRVTVGLPVFNGERYLGLAIDSVLSQTFPDLELVIADNASTDATPDICRRCLERDTRIRYFRKSKNEGAARNYNFTLEQARGEYFKWAAHDDLCAPQFVERAVAVLDAHPEVVLAYPQTTTIDADGQSLGLHPDRLDLRDPHPHVRYRVFHHLYRRPYTCNPVFGVMRTDVVRHTAGIGSYVSSDMILLGELALRGQICEIPEPLFLRRDHPGTSVRAYPRSETRAAWFDPSKKGRFEALRWRWLREYGAAIARAPLPVGEKFRCYSELRHWVQWNAGRLSRDLVKAFLWLMSSVVGS